MLGVSSPLAPQVRDGGEERRVRAYIKGPLDENREVACWQGERELSSSFSSSSRLVAGASDDSTIPLAYIFSLPLENAVWRNRSTWPVIRGALARRVVALVAARSSSAPPPHRRGATARTHTMEKHKSDNGSLLSLIISLCNSYNSFSSARGIVYAIGPPIYIVYPCGSI